MFPSVLRVRLLSLAASCLVLPAWAIEPAALPEPSPSGVCVAYFTWWENTVVSPEASRLANPDVVTGASLQAPGHVGRMALRIAERLGAPAVPIRIAGSYPASYEALLPIVQKEHEADERPALRAESRLPSGCRTLYLGFPNWDYGLPNAVKSFMESIPVQERQALQVVPFASTGTGGWAASLADLQAAFPHVQVREGIALPRRASREYEAQIDQWLASLPETFK